MFQRLQESLLENNKILFIKYDGERNEDIYSLLLIDKLNSNKTICVATDNLKNAFLDILVSRKMLINENEVDKLYNKFIELKELCCNYWGKQVVFINKFEVLSNLEMSISIILKNSSWSYMGKSILELHKFIQQTGDEYITNIARNILNENSEAFKELAK